MKKPTMQDVAAAAGVSKMTVSYALRHHPRIGAATAQRVREVAQAMNYTPNPLVAALCSEVRARRSSENPPQIAYLGFHGSRSLLRENLSVTLPHYEGAKMRSEELGFQLELFEPIMENIPAKRLSAILKYRNINGVIVSVSGDLATNYKFDWNSFYGISLGPTSIVPLYNKVNFHHYKEMLAALRRLSAMGYQRIAVGLNNKWAVTDNYVAAVLFFQQEIPVSRRIKPIFVSRYSMATRYFGRWMDTHRPDVLVDASAGQFWKMLEPVGVRVPQDMGYVTFSMHDSSSAFAGVNQNSRKIGAIAVDLLVSQMNADSRGLPEIQQTTLVSGSWVDGPTAPARNA